MMSHKSRSLLICVCLSLVLLQEAIALTGNVTIEGKLNSSTVEVTSYVTAESYYGWGANLSNVIGAMSFESVSGTIESLSTVTNEIVWVWATGDVNVSTVGTVNTVTLEYNGVSKSMCQLRIGPTGSGPVRFPFGLCYTEIPGYRTANVMVRSSGGGVLENVSIMILK